MDHKIKQAIQYVDEVLGIQLNVTRLGKAYMDRLPMFIHELYEVYRTDLFNTTIILIEVKNEEGFSILQTEKHIMQMQGVLHFKIALVLENVPAYNRKRLIEKGINFIVPGKQLFLPDLFVDLRESYINPKRMQKSERLLPSAQVLLIYHIIHRNENWQLEVHPFKEIAQKLAYTPMAITNAIENLKYHNLVEVVGVKEKLIQFRFDRKELWNIANHKKLFVSPVLKTVFIDEKPIDLFLLKANTSALPDYSDLNASKQRYYAIEKSVFYGLKRSNALINMNDYEGKYALEVWKYNPLTFMGGMPNIIPNDFSVVDPLSLYLSLKDISDERIEMALEQIIEKFIW